MLKTGNIGDESDCKEMIKKGSSLPTSQFVSQKIMFLGRKTYWQGMDSPSSNVEEDPLVEWLQR